MIGKISGEQQNYNANTQYAQNWSDRGEFGEACGDNQKALRNLDVLQSKYTQLGDVMRTTEHRADVARLKEVQSNRYANESDMCREAGNRLFY